MWHHHHHICVGQCGTITTSVLANVTPSPHLCRPVWHHHHACVGQCGTITTSVLANVAPSPHLRWPMWHHHYICTGQCGTITTSVLANVAPSPRRVSPPGDRWCDERRQNRSTSLSLFVFLETFHFHPLIRLLLALATSPSLILPGTFDSFSAQNCP